MKQLKEYLPILTVCLIFFAYSNLYYYYREFKIDIYNYITNAELLLSFLPVVVLFSSGIYSFAINYVIRISGEKSKSNQLIIPYSTSAKKEKRRTRPPSKLALFFSQPIIYILIYMIADGIIKGTIPKYFDLKPYDLQTYYVVSGILFAFLLLIVTFITKKIDFITKNSLLLSLCVVAYMGAQIQQYRRFDALKVKDGISKINLKFKVNNSLTQTSDSLVFIGQTQHNLFLYDRRTLSTQVFDMDDIDSMIVK